MNVKENKIKKIGIMGAYGSFSEQACQQYISKKNVDNVEVVPLISAEKVLSSLEKGGVDLGLFPIENSNGGIVIEAVYAMAKYRFSVIDMFEFDVHHTLLVKPGTVASHITTICSHDQALKQCRMYLKRIWPDVDLKPYSDTAEAAKDLANGVLPNSTAVIAPRLCAELFNLSIIEDSIQDLKFNYTTFLVVESLNDN